MQYKLNKCHQMIHLASLQSRSAVKTFLVFSQFRKVGTDGRTYICTDNMYVHSDHFRSGLRSACWINKTEAEVINDPLDQLIMYPLELCFARLLTTCLKVSTDRQIKDTCENNYQYCGLAWPNGSISTLVPDILPFFSRERYHLFDPSLVDPSLGQA